MTRFKRDLAEAANQDEKIARFVDQHPELGIAKKDAPIVWTREADENRYYVKD